jgi:hypothetical protein
MSPVVAAATIDTDAIRRSGDIADLSKGQDRTSQRRLRLTQVTIVICETVVISRPLIETHP